MLLMDAAQAWFIQGKHPESILKDHHCVGAHTDVYMLELGKVAKRYIWSHPGRQPFGQPVPLQCIKCKSLKSWGKPKIDRASPANATVIWLKCQLCGYELTKVRPTGFKKLTNGPLDKTERGDWYIQNVE